MFRPIFKGKIRYFLRSVTNHPNVEGLEFYRRVLWPQVELILSDEERHGSFLFSKGEQNRGSSNATHFEGIKPYKCMVVLINPIVIVCFVWVGDIMTPAKTTKNHESQVIQAVTFLFFWLEVINNLWFRLTFLPFQKRHKRRIAREVFSSRPL